MSRGERMNRPPAIARLLLGHARANLQGALEYRVSLISQALGMLLNDVLWVVFWTAYFGRFQLPGWTQKDVIALWSCLAASVGLAHVLFGNGLRLASLIERGDLDFYLTLPKPILFHTLIGRMMLMALGDLIFGVLTFGFLCDPGPIEWAVFGLCLISGATIVVSFVVIAGSLAFWLGRAQTIASQLYGTLINFSTYPSAIFGDGIKLMLYTVIPAAFLGVVPVELLKDHPPRLMLELIGAAISFAVLASVVFRRGLRHYASGNLLGMRE